MNEMEMYELERRNALRRAKRKYDQGLLNVQNDCGAFEVAASYRRKVRKIEKGDFR